METAREGGDDAVADSVHTVDALGVLVKESLGRGGAGSQKPTVLSQETAMATYEERRRARTKSEDLKAWTG